MTYIITTPLYYVNDKPHIGSTYTTIACDAHARFKRLESKDVIFITGVDEHGQKIERTADSLNISPNFHCQKISETYLSLWKGWGITNDRFVRTSSNRHKLLVNSFFQRVLDSGNIKLGSQKGWYCVGCEEYKDDKQDSKKPVCSIHHKELEWRDEDNLFFCLSKFQEQIELLIADPGFIQPISRQNEIKNFVAKGLRDFSISRVNVKWGIPVPGYPGHTFYVWFDALLGYLTALLDDGEKVDIKRLAKTGWPAAVHVIGKDILRFHSVYWPAMLIAAKLDIPKKIYSHGFLTREGKKMGKTLGNTIDPKQLLDKYGTDPVRWYLLRDIRFGQDGDFQFKRFIELINNDLANTIGNLLNRTSSMSRKWFDNCIPNITDSNEEHKLKNISEEIIAEFRSSMNKFAFQESAESILKLAIAANVYLNDTAPWVKIKKSENRNIVANDIYAVLESCRIIGLLLNPIVPNISKKILIQLNQNQVTKDWINLLNWGVLEPGLILPKPEPIIIKIDSTTLQG